jgi:hypothetical protein
MGNGFPGKCLEGWLDGAVHFRKRLVMFPCKGHFLVRQNRNRRTDRMNAFDYVVVSIEGDYANLKRTDIESDELKLVARALLPDAIVEGSKLHYEYMEYCIVE